MDEVSNFEKKLMELDPSLDDFVTNVDVLLESVPVEFHEKLIPSIFRFFEKHPLSDSGTPGTLIHLIEHYYPRYKFILLESLAKTPTYNAILMVNRILNSQLVQVERNEYMVTLSKISSNLSNHPDLVKHAIHFIEYQHKKHG